MDHKERLFEQLRKQNIRITKPRREIIDILEDKHLTIPEVYEQMKLKGFANLATVYNNIDFLLENKLIHQLLINDQKFYSFHIDENIDILESHIHLTCKDSNQIIELYDYRIIEYLKSHPIFKEFSIESLEIVVKGKCNIDANDTKKIPCEKCQ